MSYSYSVTLKLSPLSINPTQLQHKAKSKERKRKRKHNHEQMVGIYAYFVIETFKLVFLVRMAIEFCENILYVDCKSWC